MDYEKTSLSVPEAGWPDIIGSWAGKNPRTAGTGRLSRVGFIKETLNAAMSTCQKPYDDMALCFHHRDHEPVDLIRSTSHHL